MREHLKITITSMVDSLPLKKRKVRSTRYKKSGPITQHQNDGGPKIAGDIN